MVSVQLVEAAVQFGVTELVQRETGLVGVLLLSLAAVGIRARRTAMTGSAAAMFFFVVLMAQA
ncbi:hypothetical protein [Streptomyces sp. NPDC004533]|uniref:hypothetical protein n=1 Tax=Streptomyces sp. NPDC004533 TaxID=3154278 RepID=UPI0033B504F1